MINFATAIIIGRYYKLSLLHKFEYHQAIYKKETLEASFFLRAFYTKIFHTSFKIELQNIENRRECKTYLII